MSVESEDQSTATLLGIIFNTIRRNFPYRIGQVDDHVPPSHSDDRSSLRDQGAKFGSQSLQRLCQQARDVHLRQSDLLGDLRLGEFAEKSVE